jgi:copper transport protein
MRARACRPGHLPTPWGTSLGAPRHPRRVPRAAALVLPLAGLWLLATGPAAAAHGSLRASEPAAGTSLAKPPHAVTLTFSEAPEPSLSSVRVLDAAGRVVAAGRPGRVPGRPLDLRLPLHDLDDGTYTVSWRTISAVDGHPTAGTFAFGVGTGAQVLPPAQAVAAARVTPPPTPLAVAGRWAYYWGLALLVGAAATGLLVFDRHLPGRSALLLGLAVAAAAAGCAAMLLAARADAGVSLGRLLGSTTGGWLLWRVVMLAAAAGATLGLLQRPGQARPLVVVGLAAGGGMLVHALAGHAAGPSSLRWLNLAAQWAHLLAVGVWIGGLVWLLAGLRGRARADQGAVALRFSKLAGGSLAVVVVTGLARTVDELGGWRRLFDTGFGRALGVKLALFAGLLLLGAVNRYRLVPALRVSPRRRAAARLRRSVGGELWLAAGVLLAAALLSELPPGATNGGAAAAGQPAAAPALLQATGSDYATTVRVTLTVSPGAAGPNRFAADVADYDTGDPLPASRVELTGTPAARPDLASARLELVKDAEGHWQGKGPLLSIGGRWSLTTIVEAAGGGVTVPLELDVPDTPRHGHAAAPCDPTCPATSPAPAQPPPSAS